MQEELGLNMYDYGARNYDSAIGRFHNMDRFSEKYLGFSPYSYAGNNPIALLDIQGDSIGLGQNLYDKIVGEIEGQKSDIKNARANRQSKINNAIKSGKTNKAARLERRNSKLSKDEDSKMVILNQTTTELAALKKSDVIYDLKTNVKSSSSSAGGFIGYDETRNSVTINLVGGYGLGDFAHELKHGYQYETGSLSLLVVKGMSFGGDMYDAQDEVEAYARGAFFGSHNSSLDQIRSDYPSLKDKLIQKNYKNTSVTPTVSRNFSINGVETGLITVNHHYNISR